MELQFFIRVGSSVGEHMTEAHGVGGSIPSLPILIINLIRQSKTFIKVKMFISIQKDG